jgi:hypothetical protein
MKFEEVHAKCKLPMRAAMKFFYFIMQLEGKRIQIQLKPALAHTKLKFSTALFK